MKNTFISVGIWKGTFYFSFVGGGEDWSNGEGSIKNVIFVSFDILKQELSFLAFFDHKSHQHCKAHRVTIPVLPGGERPQGPPCTLL